MLIQSRYQPRMSVSGPGTLLVESAHGQQQPWVIWQDKGSLTTEWIDNKVRECIWVLVQSMRIINKQGTQPAQWDTLINHQVTRLSDLESEPPLWK